MGRGEAGIRGSLIVVVWIFEPVLGRGRGRGREGRRGLVILFNCVVFLKRGKITNNMVYTCSRHVRERKGLSQR